MATSSDHNVTETALDAVKCKLSAATLGYFRDDFLTQFVPKPTRRIPLIHRGYYLRHIAIDDCVTKFLDSASSDADVQIVSLGAGFDTLFFRLMQQQRQRVRFVEVDCDQIVDAKTQVLESTLDVLLPGVSTQSSSQTNDIAFRCDVDSTKSSFSLFATDLGNVGQLESLLKAVGVDFSLPTLVLAECVVSYLDPAPGTALLGWLSKAFSDATAILYDPLEMSDAFGEVLQQYFAVKGCELRSLREFHTIADHQNRFLRRCDWKTCRVIDMNAVFMSVTTSEEKARIQRLEAFDEYADLALCNAHYGIFVATTRDVPDSHWSQRFCASQGLMAKRVQVKGEENNGSDAVVRSFQQDDLKSVQKLFQSTHLEYSCKAVKKFVNNRVRSGDLADIQASFLLEGSHFWVVESGDENERAIVGCIGIKPHASSGTAELCRLSVDKTWRRRGLASILVSTLEAFAVQSGHTAIHLDTIESMAAAQAFYHAKGYTEAAERAKFSMFTLVSFSKPLK